MRSGCGCGEEGRGGPLQWEGGEWVLVGSGEDCAGMALGEARVEGVCGGVRTWPLCRKDAQGGR